MPHTIEDDDCQNPVHKKDDRLFSRECTNCGIFPMYADDGMYKISSNCRDTNQDTLERNFWRIKSFLNANGLKVNESKTKLTEFMSRQKRIRN